MSQVTIYLEPETLALAKAAAAREKMSVSKWFAQKVESQRANLSADRQLFWDHIDALRLSGGMGNELDFLLDPATRHAGEDLPRESFD